MSNDIDTKTDAELNEIFAVEVDGWKRRRWKNRKGHECTGWDAPDGSKLVMGPPAFCADAAKMVPWLERYEYVDVSREHELPSSWTVCVSVTRESKLSFATAPSLARAAVLALIRAKRAEAK